MANGPGAMVRRAAAGVLAVLALAGAAPAQESDAMKALTDGYNASGLALYRTLAEAPGNLVLSPYSIGSAMAMVRAGARGETEREMASALKLSLPREAADSANAAVLALLKGDSRSGAPAALVTANALVLPKGAGSVSAAYAALLRDSYAAEVIEGGGVGDINAWVARKTAGRIDRIIDALPEDTGPVLLNAIYLRAAWRLPFARSATEEGDFSLSATARVRVPVMHQVEELVLVERAGYRALRLDYAGGALAMIVVLPQAVEGLAEVTARLDAGALAGLMESIKGTPARTVALALPRFKAALSADLVPAFKSAGVRLAFGDAADFTGMSGAAARAAGLRIAVIRHRAVIEADEQGTEAAAATSVGMAMTAAPLHRPEPVDFAVDRPFLFLVVDTRSGLVLFQGRIADPRRRE